MSLITVVFVPTGIVISGDSRTSSFYEGQSWATSDATEKVFLLYNKYGIATFGAALINLLPIAHYIKEFESDHENDLPIEEFTKKFKEYFHRIEPKPNVGFFICGYEGTVQHIYRLYISADYFERCNLEDEGEQRYAIRWDGQTDVVDRLILHDKPNAFIVFQGMDIQNAVDLSRHLIRATIDQMRFEFRFPTVGGAIDTLLIKQSGSSFLSRKEVIAN